MDLTLNVWRQKNASDTGRFLTYEAKNILPDMSLLEMLDVVNEQLIARGEDPIAFDSDGGHNGTTAGHPPRRQVRDRYKSAIERWRGRAFPVIRDLVRDRTALDRII